jgi:4-amino-4-deoxy-L-arabinose transferase-like glycosyltransferase
MLKEVKTKWWYIAAIAGLCMVYIAGLFVQLMEVDASQYGSISLEMLRNHSYLVVKHRMQDYLDKPPLLFWLSSLSFSFFGVHDWAYKLPSLLFSLLAFYSTYRFAKLYYSETVARISALMLASCQAFIMINNDVRTDTLLTGAVIFSIWQIAAYIRLQKTIYLIGGSIGLALALLAKGPIGLMVPVLAFSTDWALKRQWRNFFKPQWLLVLAIVGVLIAPMVYGLYQQFGSKGPYFYFWAQSFGRLTGQNPFINEIAGPLEPDPFFFVHTFLWTYLPWTPLFLFGFWLCLRQLYSCRFRLTDDQEAVTVGGFVLAFIGLSLSAYKLPHYIFVVFPLAAVISALAAKALIEQYLTARKAIIWINALVSALLIIAAWLLAGWIFDVRSEWILLPLLVFTLLYRLSFLSSQSIDRLLLPGLFGIIIFNLCLNLHAYPELMKYQSTNAAGEILAKADPPPGMVYYYHVHSHSLDYYSRRMVPEAYNLWEVQEVAKKGGWLYTDEQGLHEIEDLGLRFNKLYTFPNYKVTKLNLKFIYPPTRNELVHDRYLIKF